MTVVITVTTRATVDLPSVASLSAASLRAVSLRCDIGFVASLRSCVLCSIEGDVAGVVEGGDDDGVDNGVFGLINGGEAEGGVCEVGNDVDEVGEVGDGELVGEGADGGVVAPEPWLSLSAIDVVVDRASRSLLL